MRYENFEGKDWEVVFVHTDSAAFRNYMSDHGVKDPLKCIEEVFSEMTRWCNDNCKGEWQIDHVTFCHWMFVDPRDAMLFKLTHC